MHMPSGCRHRVVHVPERYDLHWRHIYEEGSKLSYNWRVLLEINTLAGYGN
jgi:hypothetical protein